MRKLEILFIDGRVENLGSLAWEVLIDERKALQIDGLREPRVDQHGVCHGCRELFQMIKEESVDAHDDRGTVSREQLVGEVAVEEHFAVAAAKQRYRQRYLIKQVAVVRASEQDYPDGAEQHPDVCAHGLESAADGNGEPVTFDDHSTMLRIFQTAIRVIERRINCHIVVPLLQR